MDRAIKLLLVAGVACALLAGSVATASAGSGAASRFAPYRIPPQVPAATSNAVRSLLRGSSVSAHDAWITVRLRGGPYQIGFQNGYLTAQSSDYAIRVDVGARGSKDRKRCDTVARRYIWPLVPVEYRRELRGIADGMHAAGYTKDTLWDVVAANAWADEACYETLLPGGASAASASAASPAAAMAAHSGKGGCSAFIATGDATVDGRPVMGHDTWSDYSGAFMFNVMFYVHPRHGYDFSYQSSGGSIWSGEDWYENSAGLLLTETTLADSTYTPRGLPIFVRARQAAQYDATVAQAIDTLVRRNNGAYSNEWLIGDRTGQIASLQLGDKVYDLNETRNGFFGSSNFDWGPKTRAEEAPVNPDWAPDPYDPAVVDYARYLRWGQLEDHYYGKVDARVGMAMESDTYDSYLKKELPDARDLCGEPEHLTPGLLDWDSWVLDPEGATDGKVCTERMARHGLQSWACWGHGSGDHFDAAAYLAANPGWASDNGALAVFGLKTFSAQTTDRWVRLRGDHWGCPWR
ncbi:MAG: C45 family autoproteolytic acyltransferase/hydrolase [Thermoleophilia bacterium]